MNEKNTRVPEKRGRLVIRKTSDGTEGIHIHTLLFIISALLLLFSVIVAVTVALFESPKNTPPLVRPGDQTSDNGGESPVVKPLPGMPDLPANSIPQESTSLYRPVDSSSVKNIEGISSKAALVANIDTGIVTYANSPDERVQIASMTKVMTLVVACDYLEGKARLGEEVDLIYSDRLKSYKIAFLTEPGGEGAVSSEKVYVIDLLYGLVLQSGADAAYGLAEHFAGSEEAFVVKMNEKAAALGMTNTHFTNCVGKDDGGKNYSSMRDVATMFTYALRNPLCENIITTKQWKCVGSYKKCSSISSLVLKGIAGKGGPKFGSVTVLGGKSGQEDMSGFCLVSVCRNASGERFAVVTMGHSNSSYTDSIYIYQNYIK